mmetsp:Transcript_159868/g.298119  ORF Transcript_159868/g.298119 Transcript_159868/m.298119 type:complete len:247 (-) Transcript_159868:78-818(-)
MSAGARADTPAPAARTDAREAASTGEQMWFGEVDGQQLLPLWTQWLMTGVLVASILNQLWACLYPEPFPDMRTPFLTGALGLALAVSFAKEVSQQVKKCAALIGLYWFAFLISWQAGVLAQYVIGSAAAVMHWFYLVVQLLSKVGHQDTGDSYVNYTFLAPTALGFWNALGYKVELLSGVYGIRWPLAVCIGVTVNLIVGKAEGLYDWTPVQYVRYTAGSAGLYTMIYCGICRGIEQSITHWAGMQ